MPPVLRLVHALQCIRKAVVRKNPIRHANESKSSDLHKSILVVEPAKNCSYFYPMTLRDITPTPRHVEGSFWLWNPWSQSRVRTSSVVVGHIFFEDLP